MSCLLSNPWELLLRLLILPSYASRRGLGECIHDGCEIVINSLFKVATLIHIWVD